LEAENIMPNSNEEDKTDQDLIDADAPWDAEGCKAEMEKVNRAV